MSDKTDFDGEVQAEEEPIVTAPAKDENGTPYCLKHHCRMKQTSGGKKGTSAAYYTCPVKDCKETAKRIKTISESSIPSEPHECPRCSRLKHVVIMERSKAQSTGYYSILQCPECKFKSSPMPRPEFVASNAMHRRRSHVVDIGDH